MVACEQQAAFGEIVEAKREHSAQFRERARAVSREESQRDLRIAARGERSFALELFGELSIVVGLAVEREPTAPVARRHRLRARSGIDDGEPGVTEADGARDQSPPPVGPSMLQRTDHSIEIGTIDAVRAQHSSDSAHQPSRYSLSTGRRATAAPEASSKTHATCNGGLERRTPVAAGRQPPRRRGTV